MSKIPLFINPNAKSSKLDRINKWAQLHKGDFEIVTSDSPDHMYRLVSERAQKGVPIVAVAGGDGTLRNAVKALIGTDTALAVVPSGTVNVFARELGIYDSAFTKAREAIKGGCIKEVDIFMANGVPFVQMSGAGIDACAIEITTSEAKKKWGALAYVISGAIALFKRYPHLTLTTGDGQRFTGVAVLFGNGRKYGGEMSFFGRADNGDGLLDVIFFKKNGWSIIRDLALAMLCGGFNEEMDGDFKYLQLTDCTIESDEPLPYELDGDLSGHLPLTIAKSPQSLKVCVLPPK